jgi:hypothetical protein
MQEKDGTYSLRPCGAIATTPSQSFVVLERVRKLKPFDSMMFDIRRMRGCA